MDILNATQHNATLDQIDVVDLPPAAAFAVRSCLTVDTLPTHREIVQRCIAIAEILEQYVQDSGILTIGQKVMISGAPWMMSFLEAELWARGFVPVYAFSVRASVETIGEDGSVKKVNVFRHVGYMEAREP